MTIIIETLYVNINENILICSFSIFKYNNNNNNNNNKLMTFIQV